MKCAAGITLERLTDSSWIVEHRYLLMCDGYRWRLGMVTELEGAGYRTLEEAAQTLKDVFGVRPDAEQDAA